jgi:hypothetical protein
MKAAANELAATIKTDEDYDKALDALLKACTMEVKK